MNQLISIWAALVVLPIIFPLLCICCPCVSIAIYDARREHRNGNINCALVPIKFIKILVLKLFSSSWGFIIRDREPKVSSKKVHPFKLRSPFSVSKHYKSPDNLEQIIEKPSPQVSKTIFCFYRFCSNTTNVLMVSKLLYGGKF